VKLPVHSTGHFAYFRGASTIYDELKDPQYNPPTLMRKMVAMGWRSNKTGEDFIPIFHILQEATEIM
jgi:3-hydroxyacyl-CoA dehydrogenase